MRKIHDICHGILHTKAEDNACLLFGNHINSINNNPKAMIWSCSAIKLSAWCNILRIILHKNLDINLCDHTLVLKVDDFGQTLGMGQY